MTIKDLQKLVDQEPSVASPELQQLIDRMKGRSFWISDKTQHMQAFEDTDGNCCASHIIGLPVKPSTNEIKPIFPYQMDLIDVLSNKKRLAILKATGLGITELITIRWVIWKCCYDDSWQNGQVIIICSPRIQQAIDVITRMKKLFEPHDITFDSRSTILELNGCRIEALPGNNLPAARGLSNCKAIILEESAFWDPSLQREALDTAERYIGKADSYVILISTSNRPGDLMEKLFLEPEDKCIYERRRLTYEVGENLIYTAAEIAEAKRSFSFAREYETRALGMTGNTFSTEDIERCKAFGLTYDPDLIPGTSSRVLSVDPAWGSSATGICVTDFRDGRVCVLLAEEISDSMHADMVNYVCELMEKYKPIAKVLCDSSQVSFIKSLKAQIGTDEIDYHACIDRYKAMHVDWTLNMMVVPINYSTDNVKMLSHTRQLLQEGFVAIHPKFDLLLNALHTCTDVEGKVDKSFVGNDVFDAFRQCLTWYQFQ